MIQLGPCAYRVAARLRESVVHSYLPLQLFVTSVRPSAHQPHTHTRYAELSAEEKDKDRAIILAAVEYLVRPYIMHVP